MAIKGSLREASLPDVLQLLALGQKSGCLAVTDRSRFGHIYFERGSISYASIVNRRDRLGDLLVKNGLIDGAALAAAVEAQGSRTATRLGEILVERGAITREQLEHYIRLQIEEAVYHLFTWTEGSFYFEVDQRPEPGAMLVSINPESLLLEGARRVDEWSLIEKRIPSPDLVFALEPGPDGIPRAELTPEQGRILPLIDGHRSVRELVEDSGLVEFDVGKALFGLIQAGFAHPRGRKAAPPAGPASGARVQEHRNLGVAFYRTGMYDEAMREFRRVLELEPGDLSAALHLGLVELRNGRSREAIRRFKGVVEGGGRWPAAFLGLSLALEQLGRLDDALAAAEEAARLQPTRGDAMLSRAILLCKLHRFAEFQEALDAFRQRLGAGERPPVAYFVFGVLGEAAAGNAARAEALADEGLALYPTAAPLLLHAGALRERAGRWDEAELFYRRAVEEDGRLAPAQKSLGDALYRRGAYEEAAEAYGRALQLSTDLGDDVHFKLGNIHYKQGARERAVERWRETLRQNPAHGLARTNLELVLRAAGGE